MSDTDHATIVKLELEKLAQETKLSLAEVKRVAVTQAWKILQLTIALTIQNIEKTTNNLAGSDKKLMAMEGISKFYDTVFVVVDVPFIPNIMEGLMHKYIKTFLMALVSSTIDAMVTTFRQVGVFKVKDVPVQSLSAAPKRKRKKK